MGLIAAYLPIVKINDICESIDMHTKVLAVAHKTTLLSGKFLRVQKVFGVRNLFKQGNKRLWLI